MKKLSLILAVAMMLSMAAMLTGCGGSSSGGIVDDYKPGNPQYDYDAWKYGIDHPGFYDD